MKNIIFTKQTIIFVLIIVITLLLLTTALVMQNTLRTSDITIKKTSISQPSTFVWESRSPNNSTTVFLVIDTDKFVSVNNGSNIGMFEKYSMYSYSHKDSKITHLATNGSLVRDESVRLEPIQWLSDTELLFWAIETPIENPRGVFVFSTNSNTIKELAVSRRIVSKPILSSDYKTLSYYVARGTGLVNREEVDTEKDLYIFDIERNYEHKSNN